MTSVRTWVAAAAALAAASQAAPAQAQFFLKNPDMRGAPVRGDEPGIIVPLPGASPAEMRAGLVWSMRAALNIAALQCQFEPQLLAVQSYNAILLDHKDELKQSLDMLGGYFTRMKKSKPLGQRALDEYGTKIYSSFSTVAGQRTFCQTAGDVAHDALFMPRGSLHSIASKRMRELRNSLKPWGEQFFPGRLGMSYRYLMPRLDAACWTKREEYDSRRCGPVQEVIYASGSAQPQQLVSLQR
ncbi:MAG: hypothetical protein A4S12_03475 [Proteobacteria bacterium SG_bin5]|nr:hypothetical protein [Sphingomonas sp.]OQW44486.1 MAG: hypothetical protein A4S12_03475 [Proteobacteria bacterium SG_bin5]